MREKWEQTSTALQKQLSMIAGEVFTRHLEPCSKSDTELQLLVPDNNTMVQDILIRRHQESLMHVSVRHLVGQCR